MHDTPDDPHVEGSTHASGAYSFKKEPINTNSIRRFAQLRGTAQVKMKCGGQEVSLRTLLYRFLVRAGDDKRPKIKVAWREHRFGSLGLGPCRRYSGLGKLEDEESLPSDIRSSISLGLSVFQATCSAFATSLLCKHMLRCGLPIVEADIKNCYPTLVHRRHPEEADIAAFVADRDAYITEATGGKEEFRDNAKTLYISVFFGSTDHGDADEQFTVACKLPIPGFVSVI